MSQPKRKPKPVGNPLRLIAAKTPIGERDTDQLLFPFSAHLYEVAMGHGYGESIRCITLQLAAAYDAGRFYRHPGLERTAERAGDMFVAAGERCRAQGMTDRVVLNADELTAVRRLLCALYALLPSMEIGAWGAMLKSASDRWQQAVAARAA